MARKTEKVENLRNVHCRTCNMARNPKIMENEKHQLNDLKNEKIIKKGEKWENQKKELGKCEKNGK